jgi:phosphoglycerate dehydrogenase-like enzyme
LRVLTHFPIPPLARLLAQADDLADVELVSVPGEGPVPDDVVGDVLLTWAWGSPNVAELVGHGVRWIHTVGTGVDRFPLDCVGDRVLTCARGATAVPIAEWALACMLAFEKQLPARWLQAPPHTWNHATLGTLRGRQLGLVGLGSISLALARRTLACEMRVAALRRSGAPSPLAGVEIAASLEELIAEADHLVIAAAATDETRHLVGASALAHAKPGLHLVNVARGSLLDQEALCSALDDGRVACASLDVCEPEPLPAGHWLYTHPGVRLSAHVSWAAPGAVDDILATFVANLRRHRAGEPLAGVVDPARGY